MLQDLLSHVWKPIGRVSWYPAVVSTSAVFVLMWGYFLYQGVMDPLGGINSLWPLFGISNQLLAAVALCVGTTVLVRMGKARYSFMTLIPLTWLAIVTLTGGWLKVFSDNPKLGFLAHARAFEEIIASGSLPPGVASIEAARRMIFNDRLDAVVAGFFMAAFVVILIESSRVWMRILSGRSPATSTEVSFIQLVPSHEI
jgi:carbon starvation protein